MKLIINLSKIMLSLLALYLLVVYVYPTTLNFLFWNTDVKIYELPGYIDIMKHRGHIPK